MGYKNIIFKFDGWNEIIVVIFRENNVINSRIDTVNNPIGYNAICHHDGNTHLL